MRQLSATTNFFNCLYLKMAQLNVSLYTLHASVTYFVMPKKKIFKKLRTLTLSHILKPETNQIQFL